MGDGYITRREQYREKKEVAMLVLSPTVTWTPFFPRERTTARVFLQWPSVTKTRISADKKESPSPLGASAEEKENPRFAPERMDQ
jgi:hypothetical protein